MERENNAKCIFFMDNECVHGKAVYDRHGRPCELLNGNVCSAYLDQTMITHVRAEINGKHYTTTLGEQLPTAEQMRRLTTKSTNDVVEATKFLKRLTPKLTRMAGTSAKSIDVNVYADRVDDYARFVDLVTNELAYAGYEVVAGVNVLTISWANKLKTTD